MAASINVVGSGIAGSLVARYLRNRNYDVRLIDDNDGWAASRASSNLFCDTWLTNWKTEVARGIKVLEMMFNTIEAPFANFPSVRYIRPEYLLLEPEYKQRVVRVNGNGSLLTDSGATFSGPTVLCCGYRGNELVDGLPEIYTKTGHALFFPGQIVEAHLSFVSPFTHQKLLQYTDDTVYYADSVAVMHPNYLKRERELQQRTVERALKFGRSCPSDLKRGRRPFMKDYGFGYLSNPATGVYVLNSGGKNGMVAYASMLPELYRRLQDA